VYYWLRIANSKMAMNTITVQADPKFAGSHGPISAEDWMMQLQNSARSQQKTGAAAIAFYRSHLLSTARTRFGPEGDDFARADWVKADTDEDFWVGTFKQAYFKATTQAESVTDWARIRQMASETANDVVSRVNTAIKAFWTAVNGERPSGMAKDERPHVFKPSATAQAACALATAAAVQRMAKLTEARVTADSLRAGIFSVKTRVRAAAAPGGTPLSAEDELALYRAIDVDRQADGACDADLIKDLEQVILTTLEPVYRQQHYDELLESTKRALMLKTVQTAFSHQKCKEEAFAFLKAPNRSLQEFAVALKQAESAAANAMGRPQVNGRPQMAQRHRINALGEEVFAEEDTAEADGEDMPHGFDPALVEAVAAYMQQRNKGGKGASSGRGGAGKKKGGAPRKETRTCDFCGTPGHIQANCYTAKRIAENKQKAKSGGKVAAAQPSEN